MDTIIYQVAAHVGDYCDFDTRKNLLLSGKCFQDVHVFKTHHEWNVNAPCDLRSKLHALLKFKPRLKSLQIFIHAPEVQGLSDIALQHPHLMFKVYLYVNENEPCLHLADMPINLDVLIICFSIQTLETVTRWLDSRHTKTVIKINISEASEQVKLIMLERIAGYAGHVQNLQIGDLSTSCNIRLPSTSVIELSKIACVQAENAYPPCLYDEQHSLTHPCRVATCVSDMYDMRFVQAHLNTLDFYRRYCRISVLILENLQATSILCASAMHPTPDLFIEQLCLAVQPGGIIAFSNRSLVDPGIILLIRRLHGYCKEKRIDVKFKIYIRKHHSHSVALTGRLAHMQVSSIAECIDEGEQHGATTHSELLAELCRESPHAASIWSMIRNEST